MAALARGEDVRDITANVADVARLGYDIFGKAGPRMLRRASVETMIPTHPFCPTDASSM